MEAVGSALPQLDLGGQHHESAPERRQGRIDAGEPGLDLGDPRGEGRLVDDRTLRRRPGADPVPPGPARPSSGRLRRPGGGSRRRRRAPGARPRASGTRAQREGRRRARRPWRSRGSCRRRSRGRRGRATARCAPSGVPSAPSGCERHRVGLAHAGRDRVVVPTAELHERIGIEVGFADGFIATTWQTGRMGFHHVAIATRDLDATHRFYTEAMGFELVQVDVDPVRGERAGRATCSTTPATASCSRSGISTTTRTSPDFDPAISTGPRACRTS